MIRLVHRTTPKPILAGHLIRLVHHTTPKPILARHLIRPVHHTTPKPILARHLIRPVHHTTPKPILARHLMHTSEGFPPAHASNVLNGAAPSGDARRRDPGRDDGTHVAQRWH
jgi:hypothetical protein